MDLLLLEFITGGGLHSEELPQSLLREGELIYQALLRDLSEFNELNIVTTRDPRLETPADLRRSYFDSNIWSLWHDLMEESDSVLLVAPESDNVLLKLTEMAEECCCKIMGSNSDAVKLSTSKYQTLQLLKRHDLPVVETEYFSKSNHYHEFPCVIKPDKGAGAESCYYITDKDQSILRSFETNSMDEAWIIQQYIQGISGSITMLIYSSGFEVLAINEQVINLEQGKLGLCGIKVNGLAELEKYLSSYIERILELIPGLFGIVGIDFIYQNGQVYFLEINPRPVSSYALIHALINRNPLERLFSPEQQFIHAKSRCEMWLDLTDG